MTLFSWLRKTPFRGSSTRRGSAEGEGRLWYTHIVTPQEVIEAFGAGQIAKYGVVRVLDGPPQKDRYEIVFNPHVPLKERERLAVVIHDMGYDVVFNTGPVDIDQVDGHVC